MMSGSPNTLHRDGDDDSAREKLVALRGALLRLHKALIDMERRDYEREHGVVNVGELFRLVVDDPQFSWLHNISEFVVRIDEALASQTGVTESDSHVAVSLARKIFAPSESGDGFQKKYFDAIQRDPSVVMEHAALVRLFSNAPGDSDGT